MPFWHEVIEPQLKAGKNVIVAAHGNSLRAVIKHLDKISDADIPRLEVPTGNPLVYRLTEDLRVIDRKYLDADRAGPLP